MPQDRRRSAEVPDAETLLAAYPREVQALAQSLRQLVVQSVPGAIERVMVGWRLIGYRVPDGPRSHYFGFIAPLADSVRLGFEYGVRLSDQTGLEGAGSQVRHVTVRTEADIDAARLTPLIAEAALIAVMWRRS